MCNEKSSFDIASIGIFAFSIEHFFVMFIIVEVDSSIKCEKNHLRCLQKNETEKNNTEINHENDETK